MNDQPIEIDGPMSFAHRVGDAVKVVLRLSDDTPAPGNGEVRLRAGSRRLVIPADVTVQEGHAVMTFTVPAELGAVAHQLAFRSTPHTDFVRLQARLLARAGQPVAVLAGPKPATRMPEPRPLRPQSPVKRLARRLPAPVKNVMRSGHAAVRARMR